MTINAASQGESAGTVIVSIVSFVSGFVRPESTYAKDCSSNASNVHVVWIHEADDDNMEEMGEEFGEDLEHATFELKAIEI